MIINIIIDVVLSAFDKITGLIFFGQSVTELPLSMQEPMEVFVGSISTLVSVMPWLEPIWEIFILALMVKVGMFIYKQVLFLLQLARG